ALSLVGTLFGVAVLFVAQNADFLAAVQVIIYAGAIVVLFLFVLMLLGVDRAEDLSVEPLGGQRIAALVVGAGVLALSVLAIASTGGEATGAPAADGARNRIDGGVANVDQIGESLFTDYLFAFEVTSVLLVIAVVGAVVMARKVKRSDYVDDPLVAAAEAERAAAEQPGEAADEVPAAEVAVDDSDREQTEVAP
ncbi:MAG: NADH-quinone oxidoreductase subunit J, partial [Acidimicrobiales bacterium]|nr:NADH-quinone oxidoreductase subunit J [Acidimicrobiales bacterium]